MKRTIMAQGSPAQGFPLPQQQAPAALANPGVVPVVSGKTMALPQGAFPPIGMAPAPAPVPAAPWAQRGQWPQVVPYAAPAMVPDPTTCVYQLRFVRRLFLYAFFAVALFMGLSHLLLTNATVARFVTGPVVEFAHASSYHWIAFLAVQLLVSFIAYQWAMSRVHPFAQFLGLVIFVAASAVVLMPLIGKAQAWLATSSGLSTLTRDAAYVSVALFSSLMLAALFCRTQFSYWLACMWIVVVLGAAVAGLTAVYGFNVGMAFIAGIALLAGSYALCYTAHALHIFRTYQHLAGALGLISSFAFWPWFMLRIPARPRY
jgi:hypothetical protein